MEHKTALAVSNEIQDFIEDERGRENWFLSISFSFSFSLSLVRIGSPDCVDKLGIVVIAVVDDDTVLVGTVDDDDDDDDDEDDEVVWGVEDEQDFKSDSATNCNSKHLTARVTEEAALLLIVSILTWFTSPSL